MPTLGRAQGLGLLLVITVGCSAADRDTEGYSPAEKVRSAWMVHGPGRRFEMRFDRGGETKAQDYYTEIGAELGLTLTIGRSTLRNILLFGGYSGLSEEELETADSQALMAKLQGDALVARFFAPKITDVSGKIPPNELGWRKLVRLRARAGSDADGRGISHIYILCNYSQPLGDAKGNPFLNRARTNQVMLVTRKPSQDRAAAYWLIYWGTSAGGRLIGFLEATFNGADQIGGPVRPFWVPQACRQCHGQSRTRGTLNYLDADHWQDRTAEGDDFHVVRESGHGVIFDGGPPGTDPERFGKAFEIVREMNQGILEQNVAVGAGSLQLRAVENWLKRHEGTPRFLAPIDRPIPVDGIEWTKGNAADEALLPLLNRYCFRCHSTILYNVFDKSAVMRKADTMAELVRTHEMPKDRRLEESAATDLADRLSRMK